MITFGLFWFSLVRSALRHQKSKSCELPMPHRATEMGPKRFRLSFSFRKELASVRIGSYGILVHRNISCDHRNVSHGHLSRRILFHHSSWHLVLSLLVLTHIFASCRAPHFFPMGILSYLVVYFLVRVTSNLIACILSHVFTSHVFLCSVTLCYVTSCYLIFPHLILHLILWYIFTKK